MFIRSAFFNLFLLTTSTLFKWHGFLIKSLYGKQTVTDFGGKKERKNDFAIEFKNNSTKHFFYGIKFNYGIYWYTQHFTSGNQDFFFNGRFRYFHVGINLGTDINISKKIIFSPFVSQGYCLKDYVNLPPSNIVDSPWRGEKYFVGLNGALYLKLASRFQISLETSCIVYPNDLFPNPSLPHPTYTGFIGMTDIGLSYKIFEPKIFPSSKTKKNIDNELFKTTNTTKPFFISVSNGGMFMKRFGDDKNYLSWFKPGDNTSIRIGSYLGAFAHRLKYNGVVVSIEASRGINKHNTNGQIILSIDSLNTQNIAVSTKSSYSRYAFGIGQYKIFGKSKRNIWEIYLTSGFIQFELHGDVIESYNHPNQIEHKNSTSIRIRDNYFGLLNSNLQFSFNKNFSFLLESAIDFSPLNSNRTISYSTPWGYNYLPDPSGIYFHFNLGLIYNFGSRKK